MDLQHDFIALGIALGLGFLIGMQRERAGSRIAGSRTFPLIALFGAICGLLSQNLGSGIVIAGLVSVVGTFVVSHLGLRAADADRPGTTTEVAMLVVFGIGVLCELAPWEVGVALGGVVLVLLQAKEPLHALARRIGETEARAVVRFVIVGMVVLPVVPAVTFGPYGVWNLRYIWMVVVLVVGIGLCAYVARRALGERKGALVGGLLGGLVSSTATTASVARELRDGMPLPSAVLVASLASAMVIPRQLIEVVVVAPSSLAQLAPPLLVVLVVFLVTVAFAWRRTGAVATTAVPESKNPAALLPAFWFGVLFAAVLLAVAFAQRELGSAGLFAVAGLAGLTNVDAITLSSAGMVADGQIDAASGWRLLVLASLSNLVFKVVLAGVLGSGRLARALALAWAPAAVVSVLLLWLWP